MRDSKRSINLECILTEQEKLKYAKEMSEHVSKKHRVEDNLKSVSTQLKSEIASHEGSINSLAEKLNSGREYRMVECNVEYDFKKGVKTIIRTDTGEIAKVEEISEEERQEELV